MKILLQHKRTLQYVQSADAWTHSAERAHDFGHSQIAIDFAHDHHMTDIYVTVQFPEGDPAVSVPVPHKSLLPSPRARW